MELVPLKECAIILILSEEFHNLVYYIKNIPGKYDHYTYFNQLQNILSNDFLPLSEEFDLNNSNQIIRNGHLMIIRQNPGSISKDSISLFIALPENISDFQFSMMEGCSSDLKSAKEINFEQYNSKINFAFPIRNIPFLEYIESFKRKKMK